MDELRGADYLSIPYLDLIGKEGFSQEGFEVVAKISMMTTSQLEALAPYIDGVLSSG